MKTMRRIAGFYVLMLLLIISVSFGRGASTDPSKKERTKKTGWIGIRIEDINERIAHKYKLDSEEGAYVNDVVEESPADSAGIKEGDIIIEFNGTKVYDSGDLVKVVQKTQPGTKVSLVLLRNSEKKNISLIVGKHKKQMTLHSFRMPPLPHIRAFVNSRLLGMELMNLNEQLGEYFGTPNNEGVLVQEVEKGSTAEKAGFKAGDVIIHAGKRTVKEIEDISREVRKCEEGEKIEFEVLSKGIRKTLNVEIEDNEDTGWNYFFRSPQPHTKMFRPHPLDDTDLLIQMDEMQPLLEQMQIGIGGITGEMEEQNCEMQDYIPQFLPFGGNHTEI